MKRLKTISKHFYDDEILFKDENGDLHLKEGVKRMSYPTLTSDSNTQINYWESAMKKIETFNNTNKNWDNEQ
jgi:hypothetical protein